MSPAAPPRVDFPRPRTPSIQPRHLKLGGLSLLLLLLGLVLLRLWGDVPDGEAGPSRDFMLTTTTSAAPFTKTAGDPDAGADRPSTPATGTSSGAKTVVAYFRTVAYPPRLVPVTLAIPEPQDTRELLERLVEVLQGPPPSPGLVPPVPAGTRVLAHFLQGQDLYLDLTSELLRSERAGAVDCYCMVQALVNTVVRQGVAGRVRVLVGGKERLTLRGHFDTTVFWEPDAALVAAAPEGDGGQP